MGIAVLTIQDELDGNVSLSFTVDPQIEDDQTSLTTAQLLGLMCFHNVMAELNEGDEPEDELAYSDDPV